MMGLISDIIRPSGTIYVATVYFEGEVFQEQIFETAAGAKKWISQMKRKLGRVSGMEYDIRTTAKYQ